jgi:hypothetical protein
LDLSIVQGPFSVAPCQTLISRFATCSSPVRGQESPTWRAAAARWRPLPRRGCWWTPRAAPPSSSSAAGSSAAPAAAPPGSRSPPCGWNSKQFETIRHHSNNSTIRNGSERTWLSSMVPLLPPGAAAPAPNPSPLPSPLAAPPPLYLQHIHQPHTHARQVGYIG